MKTQQEGESPEVAILDDALELVRAGCRAEAKQLLQQVDWSR